MAGREGFAALIKALIIVLGERPAHQRYEWGRKRRSLEQFGAGQTVEPKAAARAREAPPTDAERSGGHVVRSPIWPTSAGPAVQSW